MLIGRNSFEKMIKHLEQILGLYKLIGDKLNNKNHCMFRNNVYCAF